MKPIILIIIFFQLNQCFAQTVPSERLTEWQFAGLKKLAPLESKLIRLQEDQLNSKGLLPNDNIIDSILNNHRNETIVIEFPAGDFLFNRTLKLPANTTIRGQGADFTQFLFDLHGTGNAIEVDGSALMDERPISKTATRKQKFIIVDNIGDIQKGDWIIIEQNDADLVTSDWAKNTVSQIAEVLYISSDTVFLDAQLRIDFPLERTPFIKKISPIENVFIECLKIKRLDNTAPSQTSSIIFRYAVNSGVKGVESENCTFSHIETEYCSNLEIRDCYFHDAFEYGGNGRGYGITLYFSSGEILVENNIFKHLRHSMIVQSGANGNVFAYNYSIEPFWTETSLPSNSSGDIVLHGNYVHSNLFEGNICQNIVIDNSHGPNGSYNTFFRNRAELYGIFFSATNSPKQNIVANEITNKTIPYSFINYTILGDNHFLYGNNNKGTIHPTGTNEVPEKSYYYTETPAFLSEKEFASIGTPNSLGNGTISAQERYQNGEIFKDICVKGYSHINHNLPKENINIRPNPATDYIEITLPTTGSDISIYNTLGQCLINIPTYKNKYIYKINISTLPFGVYFVRVGHAVKEIVII